VNLIAGRELFPEFLTDDAAHPGPAEHAVRWLTNASDRAAVVRELRDLKASFGQSGACERAAHILIDAYGQARPAAA
jgi:lipid A disaccharide synthetase